MTEPDAPRPRPSRPHIVVRAGLAPGIGLRVTVSDRSGAAPAVQTVEPPPANSPSQALPPASRLRDALAGLSRQAARLGGWMQQAHVLFLFGMGVYLLTRLVGLPNFPIYFFCDEATTGVAASQLVNNGLRDPFGEILPTFFFNERQYSLGTSVYLEVLPQVLFGRSVWVTRGTVAVLTLLAAWWLAGLLRQGFGIRRWWSAPLLLALVPGWFILSRTAFEAGVMVTFYTGFLYFYVMYRQGQARHLFTALCLGALAFYAYTAGQVIVTVTGLLLLIIDIRYHWKQRRMTLPAAALLVVLVLPMLRHLWNHPTDIAMRMTIYASYWQEDIPLLNKIGLFFSHYLQAFNPLFWFWPNAEDRLVFTMKNYGHISIFMLPLTLLGLWRMIRNFKQPAWRLVLVSLLAAPSAAAMASLQMVRASTFFIPVLVLVAVGLDWLWEVVPSLRRPSSQPALAGVLCLLSLGMLANALISGPTWFKEYNLFGLQYGAPQVFREVSVLRQQYPELDIHISPNWWCNSEALREYFIPNDEQVIMGNIDQPMMEYVPTLANTIYVLTPQEYQAAVTGGRFKTIQLETTLPYPDGSPGFFFTRLTYIDNIQEFLSQLKAELHKLEGEAVILDGRTIQSRHTHLDSPTLQVLFDGDLTAPAISAVNPFVVELDFNPPRPLKGLILRVGGETVQATVSLTEPGTSQPMVFTRQAGEHKGNRDLQVDFDRTYQVSRLHLELLDSYAVETNMVHMWEVTLVGP